MIVRRLEGFPTPAAVDLEARRALPELHDLRFEQDLNPLLCDSFVELQLIVLEKPRELTAPVRKPHAVLFREHQSSFHGAVPTSYHQDVLVLVMPRGIKPVVNPRALLSRHVELARIPALPGGEDDPARAILSFVADD